MTALAGGIIIYEMGDLSFRWLGGLTVGVHLTDIEFGPESLQSTFTLSSSQPTADEFIAGCKTWLDRDVEAAS